MAKDSNAFYELFLSSVDSTFATMKSRCNDFECAKQLTEEAYRLSFSNLDKLEHPQEFAVWMNSLSVYVAKHSKIKKKNGVKPCPEKLSAQDLNEIWTAICSPVAEAAVPESNTLSDEEISRSLTNISIGKAIVRRRREKIEIALLIMLIILIMAMMLNFSMRKKKTDGPRYLSTNIISDIDQGKVIQFARAISGQLSGQIGEIYQLGEDTYYIVIYLDNRASGGSVVRDKGDGETAEIISASENVLTQEQFEKLSEDEYLQVSFSSGVKAEGGNALVSALHAAGSKEIDADNNNIVLSDKDLADIIDNAEKEEALFSELFGTDALGEDYSVVLTIRCRNVDLKKTTSINLDSSIAQQIGKNGKLRVVLGDERQVISLSKEQLEKICSEYKSLTIAISQKSQSEFEILFKDPDGEEISELYGTIDICLPADSELTYVYADYGDSAENRGGLYDSQIKTITFSSRLSGKYSLIGNDVTISDMEKAGKQIQFMASADFMPLDENGCFRPDEYITRAELIHAIARMFLAIDNAPTGENSSKPVLSDLNVSDAEYSYILAGFSNEIVGGYSDGSFGGERNASREELITVCSRTLLARNIEISGMEEIKTASDCFSDADRISSYAKEHVVNAVRAGLIEKGGNLRPDDSVSRKDSADFLYKMYIILFGATK